MTDIQWAALIRGDEAYGRNHGYFACAQVCFLFFSSSSRLYSLPIMFQQAVRDVFEGGDRPPNPLLTEIICDLPNISSAPLEKSLSEVGESTFANAGIAALHVQSFEVFIDVSLGSSILTCSLFLKEDVLKICFSLLFMSFGNWIIDHCPTLSHQMGILKSSCCGVLILKQIL